MKFNALIISVFFSHSFAFSAPPVTNVDKDLPEVSVVQKSNVIVNYQEKGVKIENDDIFDPPLSLTGANLKVICSDLEVILSPRTAASYSNEQWLVFLQDIIRDVHIKRYSATDGITDSDLSDFRTGQLPKLVADTVSVQQDDFLSFTSTTKPENFEQSLPRLEISLQMLAGAVTGNYKEIQKGNYEPYGELLERIEQALTPSREREVYSGYMYGALATLETSMWEPVLSLTALCVAKDNPLFHTRVNVLDAFVTMARSGDVDIPRIKSYFDKVERASSHY